jgi:hypothetical protein
MEEEVAGSRKKWLVPILVLGIILVAFLTYQWIIPRTNLEIRTVYHESPGGGGTGGVINVNVLLTNWGNRKASSLECSVIITNITGHEVARNNIDDMSLSRGDNAEIKLSFVGSQYSDYIINIDVSFSSTGGTKSADIEHRTVEDQMNLVFVNNIR